MPLIAGWVHVTSPVFCTSPIESVELDGGVTSSVSFGIAHGSDLNLGRWMRRNSTATLPRT